MRIALLSLIGFSAFILCPASCPMDAFDTPMQGEMHAEMHDMHHADTEKTACGNCEVSTETDLAFTSTSSLHISTPVALFAFTTFTDTTAYHSTVTGIPLPHLTAIGPPVVPEIVRTIVLRA